MNVGLIADAAAAAGLPVRSVRCVKGACEIVLEGDPKTWAPEHVKLAREIEERATRGEFAPAPLKIGSLEDALAAHAIEPGNEEALEFIRAHVAKLRG